MLSRTEQLEYCKTCINRTFSSKVGIICKLTQEKASFNTTCDSYIADKKSIIEADHRQKFKNRISPDFTFGLEYIGIKSGITAGFIVILGGIIWLIPDLLNNLLNLKSLVVIAVGIIAVIISSINQFRRKRRDSKQIIDDLIIDN